MKVLLSGASGAMGKAVVKVCQSTSDTLVAGIDRVSENQAFPIYPQPDQVQEAYDVIIDFSHPSCLGKLLTYAIACKKPLVLCTTGLSEDQEDQVKAASQHIAIFQSGNMSIGINLVEQILSQYAPLLVDYFDIEIIERHHHHKVDAPSGTALMLAKAITQAQSNVKDLTFGRHGSHAKRKDKEIGIHAVRGGSIVGDHEVLFAGSDESIILRHQAQSKDIFAKGALKAANFIKDMPPGLYNMHHLIKELLNDTL